MNTENLNAQANVKAEYEAAAEHYKKCEAEVDKLLAEFSGRPDPDQMAEAQKRYREAKARLDAVAAKI